MRRKPSAHAAAKPAAARAIAALAASALLLVLAGCGRSPAPGASAKASAQAAASVGPVLAVETFLADIAQQVAGSRLTVGTLMPAGIDPHSSEPTPRDVSTVTESRTLIVNGAGMESFLQKLLASAGGERRLIEASAGLEPRKSGDEPDPHFFLAPLLVVRYVENIRDGLAALDPAGAATYSANAAAYTAKLRELDGWIRAQVAGIPAADRLLVTNHESLGYFAESYGFTVIGTIIPGVSTGVSPSARQLARLIDELRATGAKAIFLESGTDPKLARQVAREAGIRVVTELYTHSLTEAGGPAPSYIRMMEYNVTTIVDALGVTR
ncbi:MAG: zinc ABC transporter substrate-binding protein [Spirochaetes bacterium]|nr:zinc ABC transporter substrate-binding protein [Spirochaetota bacterium]